MTTYFVETEGPEQDTFESALGDCALRFVSSLDEVEADVEVLSIFIHSEINGGFLDHLPKLKLVAIRSSGYDHVDLAECESRGITVCFTPGCSDVTAAEHAFALILALSRRTGEVLEACKRGRFSYVATRGFDVKGKTLGVVGAGRIGLHVIRFAKAFAMDVIAYDIHQQPELEEQLGFRYVSLDELLRRSHIVSLHVPLTADTYHLLNRDTFRKCRSGVIVVNTARGRLIDADALIEALDQGVVAGAGLDVIEEERVMTRDWNKIAVDRIIEHLHSSAAPGELHARGPQRGGELAALIHNQDLIARPNVVFTPHIAFNSVEAVARINQTTIHNIRAFLAGKPVNIVSKTIEADGDSSIPTPCGKKPVGTASDLQAAPASCEKKDESRQTSTR